MQASMLRAAAFTSTSSLSSSSSSLARCALCCSLRSQLDQSRRRASTSTSSCSKGRRLASTAASTSPVAIPTRAAQASAGPSRLSSFFKTSFAARASASASASAAPSFPLAYPSEISSSSSSSLDAAAIPSIASPNSTWRPLIKPASLAAQLAIYKQLAKGRLSAWVVLTAMVGYAMCPTDPAAAALAMEALVQDTFGSAAGAATAADITPPGMPMPADGNSFAVTTLLATATGTALCSASANTYNQLLEIPYDAQMPRTAKRPLPSHLITPLHAFTFASITGAAGSALLYTCVNPLVASLGLLNIVLYAGVYTPLKRLSVINTWIGALVGALPPLMGWAACTNSLDPFAGQAGAWVLAAILFAWQFPHFNALSWSIRSEYARGGYRMLSAVNPGMNARVSLRWTVAGALAAAVGAPAVGLTGWTVGMATLLPSGALGLYAWRFWRAGSRASLERAKTHGVMQTSKGARATDRDPRDAPARSLFFVSLVHLPALLLIMMGGKIVEGYFAKNEHDRTAAEGENEQSVQQET